MSFLERLAGELKRKSKVALLTISLTGSFILPACQVVVNNYEETFSPSYKSSHNSSYSPSSYFNLESHARESKEEKEKNAEKPTPLANPLVDRLYQLEYDARKTVVDCENVLSQTVLESQLRIADYVARYEERWTQADVRMLLQKMCLQEYKSLLPPEEQKTLESELRFLSENKKGEESLFIGEKWTDQKYKRLLEIFKDTKFHYTIKQHYEQVLDDRNYF